MARRALVEAVDRFGPLAVGLPDGALRRRWSWGAYDEGVRFAFVVTYQDLRSLAADLVGARSAASVPVTRD